LRSVEVLGLLVADRLKESELVLDVKLYELDDASSSTAFLVTFFGFFLSVLRDLFLFWPLALPLL